MNRRASLPLRSPRRPDEVLAVGALGLLLVVSAAWWWLALAPPGGGVPEWVQAARAICFGAREDGLPDAGGWILLIGEPVGMVTALVLVAGGSLGRALRRLAGAWGGRLLLVGTALALLAGLGAAGRRVTSARAAGGTLGTGAASPRPVLSPVPDIGLVDQEGDSVRLRRFRGRPLVVTFAYGHCETVCPWLVHDALAAQRRLHGVPAVVVVTLDPWRDTPSRLPSLARQWNFGADAHVASGDVPSVQRLLARWGIAAARDPATGELTHLPLTFVVDPDGLAAHATGGTVEEIVAAVALASRETDSPPGAARGR